MSSGLPIPPRHLLFMGGDQKPEKFLSNAEDAYVQATRGIDIPSGTILDVGCGYARLAYALVQHGSTDPYIGYDILKPQIEWLQMNFSTQFPSYQFRHNDTLNARYNPKGTLRAEDFTLDPIPGQISIVFVQSVFTHMYEGDIIIYLRKIRDALSPSSVVSATFFLLKSPEHMPYKLNNVLNDHCRFLTPDEPLHVIGYDERWLLRVLSEIGFETKITYGHQDRLELRPR